MGIEICLMLLRFAYLGGRAAGFIYIKELSALYTYASFDRVYTISNKHTVS